MAEEIEAEAWHDTVQECEVGIFLTDDLNYRVVVKAVMPDDDNMNIGHPIMMADLIATFIQEEELWVAALELRKRKYGAEYSVRHDA